MRDARSLATYAIPRLSALSALAIAQCQAPTEITLSVTTDVPCASLEGASIEVGRASEIETKDPATVTRTCDDSGKIGTLVIVPTHDKNDEVGIRIVGSSGQEVESCRPPSYGPGCIVARRILHYQPSTPLTLPVILRQSCRGILCLPSETCVDAHCRSAYVSDPQACASLEGCGENTLPEADGGAIDATLADSPNSEPDAPPPIDAGDTGDSGNASDAGDSGNASDAAPDAPTTTDAGTDGGCSTPCTPVTIASNQGGPWGVAVDGTSVYWTSHSAGVVMKTPIAGGASPTQIASGQTLCLGIAVDSAHVYWANYQNNGTVNQSNLDGSNLIHLASAQAFPTWLAIDGQNVYWTNQFNHQPISKVPIGGGTITPVASNQSFAWGIAVDASNVYWTSWLNNSDVLVAPINGSASPTPIASGQNSPFNVAVYGTTVFFTTIASIMSVPTTGGTPTPVASLNGNAKPWGIAVDSSGVYWTNYGTGEVMHAPFGGTPAAVATGQGGPRGIALDATNIYWVNDSAGEVMRLRKP